MKSSWLIELAESEQTYWFTVYLGELTFSADPNDSVRFAREQDAYGMLEHNFFNGRTVKVTERVEGP